MLLQICIWLCNPLCKCCHIWVVCTPDDCSHFGNLFIYLENKQAISFQPVGCFNKILSSINHSS